MANGTGDLEIDVDFPRKESEKPLLWNRIPSTPCSKESEIDPALARLGRLLLFLGIDHSTSVRAIFGWFLFVALGVAVPAFTLWATACKECWKVEVTKFELMIQISGSCLAAISMLCMARNLRKYGLRKFLFVEVHNPLVRLRYDFKSQIRAMAQRAQHIEIIDVSSASEDTIANPVTTFHAADSTLTTTSSVNSNFFMETQLQHFARTITSSCETILQQALETSSHTYVVTEYEIHNMQETVDEFHAVCEKLSGFCTFLREIAYDAHFGAGGTIAIVRAFHDYVNNM